VPADTDFDVFLSYHWRDHELVETLAQTLRGSGLRVFLDRWYLTPGTNWLSELEKTLARCKSVAICVGVELGSWQLREQYSALERQVANERAGLQFPVIPVLLPGAETPVGFLRQNTWVDLRTRFDDPLMLAVLVKAIRGAPPGPDAQVSIEQVFSSACPYRGLLYFREQDAPFFYGRNDATNQLVRTIANHTLVAVVGASGSGKSSVVRAGLIPRIRESKSPIWEIGTLVPTDRPFTALAATLLPLLEPGMNEVTRLGETYRLGNQLGDGTITLRDVVERVIVKQPGTERLMLVVDQWEELFTLTRDESTRRLFISQILDATERAKLSVVFTLRGDFFGRAVTGQRDLSDRLQGAQVNIGPMTQTELRVAMEEPARRVGLRFEPGLVDIILAAAADEPGNLPLLEFVLRELWEQRQGGLIHKAAYEAMGGLQGAIARKADALYGELIARDPQAANRIRSIFMRLVRPGQDEQDTRRRAAASEFSPSSAALIRQLSDARLLVTSKAPSGGAETIEIAHEALIQNWQKLRDWVAADRQFVIWQQRLNATALEWQMRKRSTDLLLRGQILTEALNWRTREADRFSDLEHDFVDASTKPKFLFVFFGTFVGTMVGVAILASIFWYQVLGLPFYDVLYERLGTSVAIFIESILIIATSTKVSARFFKAPSVTWKLCFLFALIPSSLLIELFLIFPVPVWGYPRFPIVEIAVFAASAVMAIGFGGWFFGNRAIAINRGTFGWRKGIQLSVISVVASYGILFGGGRGILYMMFKGIDWLRSVTAW
jgi:energy-coupling factor transporter ATP-binding protein EcfA2